MKKTTWNDVNDGKCESRRHEGWRNSYAFGRSSVEIKCPFCGRHVTAYIWSFCGCGKRCPDCGAMHGSLGESYKLKETT